MQQHPASLAGRTCTFLMTSGVVNREVLVERIERGTSADDLLLFVKPADDTHPRIIRWKCVETVIITPTEEEDS